MRPRVTKRERKLHLSYELPHRINTASVYPVTAPNGSTVIIYAHEHGLKVLWRGGRRRKGTSTLLGAPYAQAARQEQPVDIQDDAQFESEEEEQDPDCPYPSIIQDLDVHMGQAVLHLATPAVRSTALAPSLLQKVAVVVVATADGIIRILQIPLAPPAEDAKDSYLEDINESQVQLSASGSIPTGLAMKFLPVEDQSQAAAKRQQDVTQGQLLVAVSTRLLRVWALPVTSDAILTDEESLLQKESLQSAAHHLTFHPSTRSAQLLLADVSGVVRIYDPHAPTAPLRPGSSDSAIRGIPYPSHWVMSYHTSFHSVNGATDPVFVRRKKVLDTNWVLGGKAVLVLLEDGQWGIWDTTGSVQPGKVAESFAIDGFLGPSTSSESVESTKSRKGISKLAPMTPNTRKHKAEELFKGASKAPGAASLGGISVATNLQRSGQSDESVVMWYNSDVYSITSMNACWQRSTSNNGAIGSLHSPGLSHITDINLFNENISSISHLSTKNTNSGLGQMNTQSDLFISAEHRAIVLLTLRPPMPSRSLFQLAERPVSRDVQMTDAGDSALARINAALETMGADATPTRKVGFVR